MENNIYTGSKVAVKFHLQTTFVTVKYSANWILVLMRHRMMVTDVISFCVWKSKLDFWQFSLKVVFCYQIINNHQFKAGEKSEYWRFPLHSLFSNDPALYYFQFCGVFIKINWLLCNISVSPTMKMWNLELEEVRIVIFVICIGIFRNLLLE